MNKFSMANRYCGFGDEMMQVCQRLALPLYGCVLYLVLVLGFPFMTMDNLVVAVRSLWTALIVLMCSLSTRAFYELYKMYRLYRIERRIWKLKTLIGYSPQMNTADKLLRRDLYNKHEYGKTRKGRKSPGRKKKRKIHFDGYQPQFGTASGTAVLNSLEKLSSANCIDLEEDTIAKIENVVLLAGSLKDVSTVTQFVSILGLYIKTHYGRDKSMVLHASSYISEVLETPYNVQSGTFDLPENETPNWLKVLKSAQNNWTLMYKNPGFSKISKVLSMCIALGLCDSSNVNFELAGMRLFSIGAAPKHTTAVDLVDAVFETVVYFAEGGYLCFQQGSFMPLLYGGLNEQNFEENYIKAQRCFDLAKSGNLAKEGMTENDFDALMDLALRQCRVLKDNARGSLEKNVFMRRLENLNRLSTEFNQVRVEGGLRVTPYSIGIFGGTSVGKSTISNILMVTTLLSNGYQATDDRLITLNETDKFWSNYRSYINAILNDDVGNTKAAYVDNPPTRMKLQIVNNVKLYANMAEADMKGKVAVQPMLYCETKNIKDGGASLFSNCPISIDRRDAIVLTVSVKPPFATHTMLDFDKIQQYYEVDHGMQIPLIPDCWNVTVERAIPIKNPAKGGMDHTGYELYRDEEGKPMVDKSLPEVIRWITKHSEKHFKIQEHVVESNTNLAKKLTLCPDCRNPTQGVCVCEHLKLLDSDSDSSDDEMSECSQEFHDSVCDEEYTVQFGWKTAYFLKKKQRALKAWWTPFSAYVLGEVETAGIEGLVTLLNWLEESPFATWTNWIPQTWIAHPWIEKLIYLTNKDSIRTGVKRTITNNIIFMILTVVIARCTYVSVYAYASMLPLVFVWMFWTKWICIVCVAIAYGFFLTAIAGAVEFEKRRLYDKVSSDSKAMPAIFKHYRDRHVQYIIGAGLFIATIYALAIVWREFKAIPDPQGNLAPTSVKEIEARDVEKIHWAKVEVSPIPSSAKSKCTTVDQLQSLVEGNLAHMTIDAKTKVCHCDAFFPGSNVALIPNHMWTIGSELKTSFVRHDPESIGGNFKCFLSKEHSVHIPDTDLSLVWVPNGGDWKDLTEYFPLDRFSSVPGRLTYKNSKAELVRSRLRINPQLIHVLDAPYFGAKYDLEFKTFEGLCMATLITETNGPLIGGFHLAGKNGETAGASGLLTKKQYLDAFESLKAKKSVLTSASTGDLNTKEYGIQYLQSTKVHTKSPVNTLPVGTNGKVYGSCIGRATYHSTVEPSVLAPYLEDLTGFPQMWGKPKFSQGDAWIKSLTHSLNPSIGVEGTLLAKATEDYMDELVKVVNDFPELKGNLRPLERMETVAGIDGLRFIDKMDPNTSVGFPLSGCKSKFLTFLDPAEHETHQNPVELDQKFWDRSIEMEVEYAAGRRCYPVFKACLKDEATKLTKDKVRVFQGCPIAMQLLVRKYFLPVARILSVFPLISECAVGVNADGPEWEQLSKHISKFGEDRILAGDYKTYDLRMPAQLMFAAFRVMIEIARASGNYTAKDLAIMHGIATDICYPLMAYNGDLIQHFGSNPSGQNLTVYINSIVNSLLFRCAYYYIYTNREVPVFRKVCALSTYGDDAKSSVRKGYDEFNHISVASFLAEHDMIFTMPDKESTPIPYMRDEDADFLKRSNFFHPELQRIVGRKAEESIFKSMYANLKSKNETKEQVSMSTLDDAIRDYMFYGREMYEKRQSQLKEAAILAKIDHGCTQLDVTYDDALVRWVEKYNPPNADEILAACGRS